MRAALRWRFAEPIAPAGEDLGWFERELARLSASPGVTSVRALLLGVTPGIATMRWPGATSLVAVDWSEAMFQHVWPREGIPEHASTVCADWRELPIASGRCDVVVGDGCYSALPGLADMALLNAELHRVLRRAGHVCMRCFCRPSSPLDAKQLFDRLLSGRIKNLDLFRWLLAMTVHGQSRTGVALRTVWRVWKRAVPDTRALQAQIGCSEDEVANMERWADSSMSLSFPTLQELRDLAAPQFEVLATDAPSYAWGECFPRLLLRAS
jgi:SAM-dependent methyltransferase